MKKKFLGMGIILASLNVGTLLAASSNISLEQAKAIALKKVPGGIVTNIELDYERNKAIYEIDIVLNQYEYDLKLDAKTGSGISVRKELRANYSTPQNLTFITKEQAKSSALTKVPGATVRKIELDKEDRVYEIELRKGTLEYDLEIDAHSGQVLSCKIDD